MVEKLHLKSPTDNWENDFRKFTEEHSSITLFIFKMCNPRSLENNVLIAYDWQMRLIIKGQN
jgi:hypothetical protein